jgi:hypothetical protein
MVERAGEAAGFDMKIHPHMLRHACGFKLGTMASIPARSKPISGINRSSIRCVIPSWRRRASKACFGLTAPIAGGVPKRRLQRDHRCARHQFRVRTRSSFQCRSAWYLAVARVHFALTLLPLSGG